MVVCFFQIKCEDMDASFRFSLPQGHIYKSLLWSATKWTCLPEKAFSHAKGFCLLPVIKMEICKQRLDTNNSVICELVSICCESNNINKAYIWPALDVFDVNNMHSRTISLHITYLLWSALKCCWRIIAYQLHAVEPFF